jgi:hypothetical protein
MEIFNWVPFLAKWSQDWLESSRQSFSSEVIASGWLGYSDATEQQVAQVESRLRMVLPPSYRAFLLVTNGWRKTTPFIPRLWSTEEVDWFRRRHQDDWITPWLNGLHYSLGGLPPPPSVPDEEYFVYGEEQAGYNLRWEYLETALEISDVGDTDIYLLNPQVVTATGEWRAWVFESEQGAKRYRSFWDLMQAEYQMFLYLRDNSSLGL